ncbi:MAG TPA: PEP-utilizing enzyme [Acidimicrobiales bacterium]|nr:PEP-utilizing enzyme [Acidimicrobiales bacterium]
MAETAEHDQQTQDEQVELVFEPPGPGSWTVDKGHFPYPYTKFHADVMPGALWEGFRETFAGYGIPAEGMRAQFVNGFSYGQVVPVDPAELGARAAAAEEALATRRWRLDLQRWDDEAKPAAIARHRELAEVDVDAIVTTELIRHLRDCHDHTVAMIVQHHRFNGAAMIPLGDLLASVLEWTGGSVAAPEVMALLAGASPISRGECPERRAVLDAIAADTRATTLLDDDAADPAELLDALRSEQQVDPPTAEAVHDWLTLVGHRILDGFDVNQPRAIERPAVLLSSLRHARAAAEPPEPDPSAVRDRIPPEHRDAFDERLAEARLTYRLRDERGIYSDATALGIMRRAMLAAGSRLASIGLLASSELAVDASVDELVALLDDHPAAPTSEELRARARFRLTHGIDEIPPVLGDPPSPPPPIELFPPAMARTTRALLATSASMKAPDEQADDHRKLHGVAASPGRHAGTARIVHSIDDLERVGDGDVIVTITTTEAFNLAMACAAAVVTDHGGLLGHAAITAREFGIPAVVGTQRATSMIAEGTLVTVDGTNGEVSW